MKYLIFLVTFFAAAVFMVGVVYASCSACSSGCTTTNNNNNTNNNSQSQSQTQNNNQTVNITMSPVTITSLPQTGPADGMLLSLFASLPIGLILRKKA